MNINQHGADWRQIKQWAEEQIRINVRELSTQGVDHGRTEFLRGSIGALQALLTLPDAESRTGTPAPY